MKEGKHSFGKLKVSVISFGFEILWNFMKFYDNTWKKLYFQAILCSLYISRRKLFSSMFIWKMFKYCDTCDMCIRATYIIDKFISTHPALWNASFLLHFSLLAISKCLGGFELIQCLFNQFKYSMYFMCISRVMYLYPAEEENILKSVLYYIQF